MQIAIDGDADAVRVGLADLLNSPPILAMADDARGTAEIVLAEVLNNIVEHAYAQSNGQIIIGLTPHPRGLLVNVCDTGGAFPKEELPQGLLPPIGQLEDLPEGGFGWFLIRRLVHGLTYQRKNGRNHLSFYLKVQ